MTERQILTARIAGDIAAACMATGKHPPWTVGGQENKDEAARIGVEIAIEIVDRVADLNKEGKPRICEDCGCKLGKYLGDLERHGPGCSNFPL